MPSQEELLIDLLHEVSRSLGEQIRKVFAGKKLPITTMIIARQLKKEPGLTVSGLARSTGVAKSHISIVVDELSRRGWVEKRADPADQRLLRLYLTGLAAEQMKLIRVELRQQLSALVAGLPERRREELVAGLSDILAALQGRGKGA